MSRQICFVTCIYEPEELHPEIPQPSIRDALIKRYFNSLISMGSNSDAFFIIYCSSKNYNLINDFLMENFPKNNYLLVTQDVEEFSAFSLYNANREFFTSPSSSRRRENYFSMVLSKPGMMLKALSLVDCENFFWVDAGLANETFFPRRHVKGDFIPFMGNDFHERLLSISQDCEFYVVCNRYSFWPWLYSESLSKGFSEVLHNVIGGLWGGKKHALKKFVIDYFDYLDKAFSFAKLNPGKVNFTEETIFSQMFGDFVEVNEFKVRVEHFSSWVHEDDIHSTGFDADDESLRFFYQVLTGEKSFDRNGLMFLRGVV